MLLCLLAATLLTARASASGSAPCIAGQAGPTCHVWTARVTKVDDGDTIEVAISGNGGRTSTIRFNGIQAMEQHVYSFEHPKLRRGDCHALEATARLESIIRAGHWLVRLSTQHPTADTRGRLGRWVAVKSGGRWQDIGAEMLRSGNTLWMPSPINPAWNETYNRLSQEAAQAHLGLWNPTHCGWGPSQEVPLRVLVSSDPAGVDTDHVNGEWIKVVNLSPDRSVDLSRWWVRDAMLRRFTFPARTTLAANSTVTVYIGRGHETADSFYWGFSRPIFMNTQNPGHLGGGGYLFDPQGDLRASLTYPCTVNCADPNMGALTIRAHPQAPEYVLFKNVSDRPVNLYGYEFVIPGSTYPFSDNSWLQPGESMRLDMQGDPSQDSALRRSWGRGGYTLPDRGGSVKLQTFDDIVLGCDAWGEGYCGP